MNSSNSIVKMITGLVMLAAGLYWFLTSVTVTSIGFYGFTMFGRGVGGLVVVPFIAGICWLFAKPEGVMGKLLTVLGLVIIIASVIAGTNLYFMSRTLYEYLLMLVLIVGGFALLMRGLLSGGK